MDTEDRMDLAMRASMQTGVPVVVEAPKDDTWKCQLCTTMNTNREHCSTCNAPRINSPPAKFDKLSTDAFGAKPHRDVPPVYNANKGRGVALDKWMCPHCK